MLPKKEFAPRRSDLSPHSEWMKVGIYLAFFLLMFLYHLPMGYVSDDAVVQPTIENQTLLERFLYLYRTNGRIFTDTLTNLFYRMPMMVWKIFDSCIYVAIAYLIVSLFTKNQFSDVAVTCSLIALYPINYLMSAGYIATSANYVYPILSILIILLPIVKPVSKDRPVLRILQHFAAVASVLYATNHDQTALVLILGLLAYSIYVIVTHSDTQTRNTVIAYFALSVVSYLFMYIMPGHINRMNADVSGDGYPPNYVNWSIWQKIYVGYTSTVANIMFYHVPLFQIFCVDLTLLAWKHRSVLVKLMGLFPSAVMAAVYVLGRGFFVTIYPYTYWLPDLWPISGLRSLIPLFTSVAILICIFTVLITCTQKKERKYLLCLLLILAAISRELMGFSATVFYSSFRTFTFQSPAHTMGSTAMVIPGWSRAP